jgi:hypothetical protein
MQAPPGWYPDWAAPGTVRYWTGQEWTAHTATGSPSATYSEPAPAAAWSAPSGPWANPYAAASIQQPGRTAARVTLAIIAGVLATVVMTEVSHVRQQSASHCTCAVTTARGNTGVPAYVPPLNPGNGGLLPPVVAGLNLNPQSQNMAHHLTTQAESQLALSANSITIGYYETPAGTSKVFIEMIRGATGSDSRNPADLLGELEAGFGNSIGEPAGSAAQLGWSTVSTRSDSMIMYCAAVTQIKIPIRACAFVQGSTLGVIGVYNPAPADEPLIDEILSAITGS